MGATAGTIPTASTTFSTDRALTVSDAPTDRAKSSLSSAMSTATTRAPIGTAIMIADRPTPPQPKTATHCPAPTRPWAVMARKAVTNRQPRLAAASEIHGTRQTHQVDVRVADGHILGKRSPPGESRLELVVADLLVARQALGAAPAAADKRQGDAVARFPVVQPPSRWPCTTPASSWPGTWGRRMSGSCPFQPCQSLRHSPWLRP
jgi:hypothetical protein